MRALIYAAVTAAVSIVSYRIGRDESPHEHHPGLTCGDAQSLIDGYRTGVIVPVQGVESITAVLN